MAKASAQYYVDFSWYLWLKNPPRLTTPQKFCGFLFGKIESPALYIVKGKVQQKPPFKRDIEWGNVKGFGTIPTRENPRPAHSVKTGILRKGYPFPMLAAKEVSGKWVLIGRQSQYLHLLQGFQDCFRQRLQKMQMKKQEIRMPKKYVTSHHHSLNFVHYMAYIFSKD